MKKTVLKTCLCLAVLGVLLSLVILPASAENGFVFQIKGVNQSLWGEDGTICTTQEAYENCNPKWAITVVCEIVSERVLKVVKDPIAGQGEVPSEVKLKENQVAVVIHSSTSDPEQAETYPNVFGKLAALDMKKGQFLVLDGLDLANATGAGTATVANKEKDIKLPETSETEPEPEPESSDEPEPVESSEPEPEPEPESSDEPEPAESSEEPAPAESSEEPVNAESMAEPAQSQAESQPEQSQAEQTGGGFPWWGWVLIGVGAVAVVCVIVAIVSKKK